MNEFDPNEVPNHRSFDLAQFRQGAPIKTRRNPAQSGNAAIRVLCSDRVGPKPVVALVKVEGQNQGHEIILEYFKDGCITDGSPTHWADIVMAPIGNIDGTDVYWGDKIYHRKTGAMNEIGRSWPGMAAEQILRDYALQPPTIEFNGRPLSIWDELWYKNPNGDYWKKVKAIDHWTTKYTPGADTTHFGFIKANLDNPHLLDGYSWDFPVKVKIEGEDLKIGETVWYKHNPSDVGIPVTSLLIEMIHNGDIKAKVVTRRPWVKKTVWQAQAMIEDEEIRSDPILVGPIFNSEEECNTMAPSMMPPGYMFLSSMPANSYYV